MLVLTRKIGESISIGSHIDVVVLDAGRGRVKLGFSGPREIPILRGELADSAKLEEAKEGAVVRASAEHNVSGCAPLRAFRVVAGTSQTG